MLVYNCGGTNFRGVIERVHMTEEKNTGRILPFVLPKSASIASTEIQIEEFRVRTKVLSLESRVKDLELGLDDLSKMYLWDKFGVLKIDDVLESAGVYDYIEFMQEMIEQYEGK